MVRTYARIAAVVLLAVALMGWVVLGWSAGAVLYHAGLALLFAFAGFYPADGRIVRMMVGGLGVLLVAVKAVVILAPLALGSHLQHGPIEISCLIVGISSILATRFLPNDSTEV